MRTNIGANLNKAKKAQNDEFYTQLSDIEAELKHYKRFFKNKTIYCNCDNPYTSNFVKYFIINFNKFKLKRLIATCYAPPAQLSLFAEQESLNKAYKLDISQVESDNYEEVLKQQSPSLLIGDGDFKSPECLDLLKQADILTTNPPFSVWRDFALLLLRNNKRFIILGHYLQVEFGYVFEQFIQQKLWLGTGLNNDKLFFERPSLSGEIEYAHVPTCWYTNIPVKQHYKDIPLTQKYTSDIFPCYDNYNAINVNKTADIPCDYNGLIGVPPSFLKYWNPNQFEIIGSTRALPPYRPVKDLFINGIETFSRVFIRHKR